MTRKYITISLSQAKELRGALNTSAESLLEIVDRYKKGLPYHGCLYHEYKAGQLKKLAKQIDKKIRKQDYE